MLILIVIIGMADFGLEREICVTFAWGQVIRLNTQSSTTANNHRRTLIIAICAIVPVFVIHGDAVSPLRYAAACVAVALAPSPNPVLTLALALALPLELEVIALAREAIPLFEDFKFPT